MSKNWAEEVGEKIGEDVKNDKSGGTAFFWAAICGVLSIVFPFLLPILALIGCGLLIVGVIQLLSNIFGRK